MSSGVAVTIGRAAEPRVRRYTRLVGPWMRSVSSLTLVLVLAGSPTLLAVCLALCEPAVATHEQAAPACHGATHESAPETTRVAGTDHGCCMGVGSIPTTIVSSRADGPVTADGSLAPRQAWADAGLATAVVARARSASPPPSPPGASPVLRI